jgi:outer membrane receptor protein involved in Fe transport
VPPDQNPQLPLRRAAPRAAALACAALWCAAALAASPGYSGRRVIDVLHELGTQGLRLIYSSETVPDSLRVLREPVGNTPDEVLADLLAQHGLEARRVGDGAWAIVRAQPESVTPPTPAPSTSPAAPANARLEEIVVASSRYSLSADVPDAHTLLTQDEIEGLPRFAEDALKAVHRLPGAASNGLSGLANIRGGEANETLVVLDGLPLYDPFHLQLLLSPASLLDPRLLSGLDVHAGGFTAEFGDRMSAVIEATTVQPEADRYYELGLSLFHAQALASQRFADGRGQWLVAARRSNLDEVADFVDSEIGEASYMDGFGRVDYEFSPRTRGSLHMLLSTDSAEVINAAETEFAEADYRNSYFWATLQHDFSDALAGSAILSWTDVSSDRTGEVDEAGRRTGAVDDEREYDVLGLKLDGSYSTPRWLHRFGLELRHLSASYDYASAVRFEPGYPFPDSAERVTVQALDPEPSGAHVAAYATSRVLATERLAIELGLRWDTQSYADTDSDRQWSPRINLLYQAGESTRLRASWGRYGQFQGINELQVEDGIEEFFPTQKADHAILGVEQGLPADLSLRIEGYRKDYSELRPRYESLFDPLSLVPELRWDRVRIAPDSARAEGIEWLLTRRSDSPWNGWLNYTWSRVHDEVQGDEVRRSWDQTHSFGGGLTWSSNDWLVTLAGTYHTGWPTTPVRVIDREPAPDTIELGARNSARYPDFSSVDLRVSRDFALPRGALTVFAEVTNALDRRNPCCTDFEYRYEADGSLVLDREYRHWLPLVPSVGVLWRY